MSVPSISLIRTPSYIEPFNKEMWFETTSTASNSTDFKYIYQLDIKNEPFDTNPFRTLSTIYKVPPRPSVNSGFFTPHKMISSFLEYYPVPFQKGWNTGVVGSPPGQNPGVLDNYFEYRIKYGFEYNPNLTFSSTFNYLGNLGLSFSTNSGLTGGDLIIIEKNNPFINPQYDGTASVLGVAPGLGFNAILDIPYGVSASNEGGKIVNLQRLTATSGSHYAFNGTRQYWELDKDYTKYIIGYTPSTPSEFLTTWPYQYPKRVYRGYTEGHHPYETISMINNTFTASFAIVNVYDSSDNYIIGFSTPIGSTNRFRRLDFGIGPQNLSNFLGFGFFDWTDPTYDYYTLQIFRGTATQSVQMKYKLYNNCFSSPIEGFTNYEPTTLMFLNRLGGWDYFTFIKDKKKTLEIGRQDWFKILDPVYTYGKIYTQPERGKTNLATTVEETYEIKSDWITDIESEWLSELLTSTEVYEVLSGTYSSGNLNDFASFTGRTQPINIVNTSYEVQTTLRQKMYNLTIQYKWAQPLNLQNQ